MASEVNGSIRIGIELSAKEALKEVDKLSKGVLNFDTDCVDLASDLEKVQRLIDTVFGAEGSKAIESFAGTAAKQFGLSELSAKEFTGNMGLMLKSMGLTDAEGFDMSTGITELAAVISSLYGQDPQEVFDKLRDGVLGNIDALQDLGIILSDANLEAFAQDFGQSYEAMSEAEKATLRYKYIMANTNDEQKAYSKNSKELANSQDKVKANFDNLKTSIGECLLQALEPLLGILNKIISFFVEHPKVLGAFVVGITAMAAAITVVVTAITALGVAMFIASVAGSAFLLPLFLIPLIIGAIAAGVYLLIQNWSTISGFFMNLWNTVSSIFQTAWNGIQLVFSTVWGVISAFFSTVWNGIVLVATTIWGGLVTFFTTLWEGIVLAITTVWTGIKDFLSELWTGITEAVTIAWTAIKEFFSELWTGISSAASTAWEGVQTVWSTVATWFTDNVINPLLTIFGNLKNGVIQIWNDIWSGIKTVINDYILWGIEAFINGIISGINSLIAALNRLRISVPSWVTKLTGISSFGFSIKTIDAVSLPRLAQGAVIPPNRQFLAVLGDQKSGINIETPLDTMIEAFKSALSGIDLGGDGSVTVTMPVYLDSEKIYEGQKKVQRRRGVNLIKGVT